MANTESNDNEQLAQPVSSTLVPLLLGGNQMLEFGISLTQVSHVKLDRNNFLLWKNMMMGWLYSSMTLKIAMRVMGSSTSCHLWNALQESFGVTNKSRVTFLISELQRTRKESMSIDQYLNTIKQLADNLEIAGKKRRRVAAQQKRK